MDCRITEATNHNGDHDKPCNTDMALAVMINTWENCRLSTMNRHSVTLVICFSLLYICCAFYTVISIFKVFQRSKSSFLEVLSIQKSCFLLNQFLFLHLSQLKFQKDAQVNSYTRAESWTKSVLYIDLWILGPTFLILRVNIPDSVSAFFFLWVCCDVSIKLVLDESCSVLYMAIIFLPVVTEMLRVWFWLFDPAI